MPGCGSPHRNQQGPVRRKFKTVHSLVMMTQRIAPENLLRLQIGRRFQCPPQSIKRGVGKNQKIVAQGLQIIDPGILRKPKKLPPRQKAAILPTLINIDRLTGPHEKPPVQIHIVTQEKLIGMRVD